MPMNEADTRANLIDPKLVRAGWGQVEESFIRREVNITQGRIISGGKRTTPVISDYVLTFKGRNLATIEAERLLLIRSFAGQFTKPQATEVAV